MWQIHDRMKLYNERGIRCYFIVFDCTTHNIYAAWLDELMRLEIGTGRILTKTCRTHYLKEYAPKCRCVFDLRYFEVLGVFDDDGNIKRAEVQNERLHN